MDALSLTTEIEKIKILFVLLISFGLPSSINGFLRVSYGGVGLPQQCVHFRHRSSRLLMMTSPDLGLVSPMLCECLRLLRLGQRPAAFG